MRLVLLALVGLAGGGLLAGALGGCNPFEPDCRCPEPGWPMAVAWALSSSNHARVSSTVRKPGAVMARP